MFWCFGGSPTGKKGNISSVLIKIDTNFYSKAPACEHAFCKCCITEWISRQPTCPVDRLTVTSAQLRQVPRILRNLLSRYVYLTKYNHFYNFIYKAITAIHCASINFNNLKRSISLVKLSTCHEMSKYSVYSSRLCIHCDNAPYGCTQVLKLDSLNSHLEECEYNPKRPLPCEQGCGLIIPKDELKDHNCVKELRSLIHTQEQKMKDFVKELNEQKFVINEQKREMQLLKVGVKSSILVAVECLFFICGGILLSQINNSGSTLVNKEYEKIQANFEAIFVYDNKVFFCINT